MMKAVREIRERIKELIDDGVKVNNFDEMKKEIIDHVKKLKEQGVDVKVGEDQIINLANKIFNEKYEKYERKTYIDSEIDKFLEKYGDKNISISYDKNKNKFNTEKITKSLKKLRNKLIIFSEFKEESVCYYHVTYAFQSESTLYSCLSVKELFARSRREI